MLLFFFLSINQFGKIVSNETTEATVTDSLSCNDKNVWDPTIYYLRADCFTDLCSSTLLDLLETYINCSDGSQPKQTQVIAQNVADYLLNRATFLKANLSENNLRAKIPKTYSTIHFDSEYGLLKKKYIDSWNPFVFDFQNSGRYELPPTELENDETSYQFTVYNSSIVKKGDDINFLIDKSALRQTFEYLGDKNILPVEGVDYLINSRIVSLTFYPPKAKNTDFASVNFVLEDYKTTTNHRCVKLIGGLGTGYWTDSGCHLSSSMLKTVLCRCDVIEGTFAVVSEIAKQDPENDELPRDFVTIGLSIVCYGGITVSLLSILFPYIMKCTHLGGMILIYRYFDFTHALEYVLVLIGVQLSEDVESSKFIGTAIHFIHHSVMMWFACEGAHLIHGITPLYDEKIGNMFFYSTLAFGIPAALAGAVAGYEYPYEGITQYIWPYPSIGPDLGYFILPTICIILLVVVIDIFLIYDLMSWIGSNEDYLYVRSKKFIARSIAFTLVFPVTHLLGLISMQNSGGGFASYLLIGFLGIQAIQALYFHVISNFEVWTFRNDMLDKAEKANVADEEDEENENDFNENEYKNSGNKSSNSKSYFQEVDIDGDQQVQRAETPMSTGSQTNLIANYRSDSTIDMQGGIAQKRSIKNKK